MSISEDGVQKTEDQNTFRKDLTTEELDALASYYADVPPTKSNVTG